MTNTLDALYDAACKVLLKSTNPAIDIPTEYDSVVIERNHVALSIIDRWLARREADRQYELQVSVHSHNWEKNDQDRLACTVCRQLWIETDE